RIVEFLPTAVTSLPVEELCRKHGLSDGSYSLWRSKFGGLSVSDAKKPRSPVVRSGLKAALVCRARLGGGRQLIIPLFVLSGDLSLRRLLNVQAPGLGVGFARELGTWSIGDDQTES